MSKWIDNQSDPRYCRLNKRSDSFVIFIVSPEFPTWCCHLRVRRTNPIIMQPILWLFALFYPCFFSYVTAAELSTDRRIPELRRKTMRFRHIQVPERRGRRARNSRHARLRGPGGAKLRADRRANRHVVRPKNVFKSSDVIKYVW